MKCKSVIVSLISVTLASLAHSASIYSSALINADGGASDRVVLGTNGSLLALGFAGTGSFATLTDIQVQEALASNSISTILSDFTTIGTDDFVLGNDANLSAVVPGNFVISIANVPTSFINKTIYTFIGDGSTLATSDGLALFRLNERILADPAPPALPISYSFGLEDGTLLFGTSGTLNGYANSSLGISSTDVASIGLVSVVPEPSSALLGALGAFGLLRRRRN